MNRPTNRRDFMAAAGSLAVATRGLSEALAAETVDPPPSAARYDVVVVGLGAMGAACLFHLALRGVRALGLEQFDIAHALGSSGGFSRQTKVLPYMGGPFESLIRRANENWTRLEKESGQRVFERCGWLQIGASAKVPDAARETCEHLDAAALTERFPQFDGLPPGTGAVLDRDGGLLRPELAIASQCRVAVAKGAHIRAREPVTAWSANDGGVEIVTAKGRYRADHLVIAAGAWTGRLVPALRERIQVTRLSLGWFNPTRPEDFAVARFPTWGHGDYYGFPILDDFPGIKIAKHWRGEPADPVTIDREPNGRDEEIVRDYLARHMPAANGELAAFKICMYVHGGPWLGPLPGEKRVSAIAACNGGGFKFSSAYGEALADLATAGRTELPVGFMAFA